MLPDPLPPNAAIADRPRAGRTPTLLASIVVLNLNGRRHLSPLLAHLAQQTVRDFELIFVDNGSSDDSVSLVAQGCAAYGMDLQVIRNAANAGFAPACNQGLAVARAPWVAMLNNDTRPERPWLEHLLAGAAAGPRVGMVASKMLRVQHPDQIDSAGIAVDWAGIAWDWRGGEIDTPCRARAGRGFWSLRRRGALQPPDDARPRRL